MMNTNRNKKSPWFMAAIGLTAIAVLLSSSVLLLKLTKEKDQNSPITLVEPGKNNPVEVVKPETGVSPNQSVEPKDNLSTASEAVPAPVIVEEPITQNLALEFVPKPGMILTFNHYYTDGMEGKEREIMAKLDPGILVSKAIMIEEDPEPLLIYHFVEGQIGIYLVQNDNPEDSVLWLPNNPKVGDTWKDPYNEFKIMEMGVSIDAGGKTFENCIMRKNTNNLAGFTNISYIAPGYGEVYSVYQGGSFEFEMVGEEPDNFELGQDVMKGKLKYLEGILNYRNK